MTSRHIINVAVPNSRLEFHCLASERHKQTEYSMCFQCIVSLMQRRKRAFFTIYTAGVYVRRTSRLSVHPDYHCNTNKQFDCIWISVCMVRPAENYVSLIHRHFISDIYVCAL